MFDLLLAAAAILCGLSNGESNILLRISRQGFEAGDEYARRLLDRHIPHLELKPFTLQFDDGPGRGTVTVAHIATNYFDAPVFSIRPRGDNVMMVRTEKGMADVGAHWNMTYEFLDSVPVAFDGRIRAKAQGLLSDVALLLTVEEKRPKLAFFHCVAKIEHFSMELSGGFIANVMDIFNGGLTRRIRKALEMEFCRAVERPFIRFIQTHIDKLFADLHLSSDPLVLVHYDVHRILLSDETANMYMNGVVEWEGNKMSELSETSKNTQFPTRFVPVTDKMTEIYLQETLLQSAFSNAHFSGYFDRVIGRNDSFFRTSCTVLCLGSFLTELETHHPDKSLLAHVRTTQSPRVTFRDDKYLIEFIGSIVFHLVPRKTREDDILEVGFNLTISLELAIADNNDVTGFLFVDEANVVVKDSKVGPVDQENLESLMEIAIPFLEDAADNYLSKGFILPVPFDWKYRNSQLDIVKKSIRFQTDISIDI